MAHLPGPSLCSQILASSRKRQWNISALQAFGFLSKNLWFSKMLPLSFLSMVFTLLWIRRSGQQTGGLMRFLIIARIRSPGGQHQSLWWFKSTLCPPRRPGLSSCQDSSRSPPISSSWRPFLWTVLCLQKVLTCSLKGVSLQVPVHLHRDSLSFLLPRSLQGFGYPLVFQYMISCPQCPVVPLQMYPWIKLPYVLKWAV